jgi:hypothetical protein
MNKRYWAVIGAVVVVVGIIIFFSHSSPQPSSSTQQNTSPTTTGDSLASSAIVTDLSSVPETTLQTIGKGSAATEPQSISAPALRSNQKPEVFFEGAEYCPYCATERWPMAVALSKFGTFTNLKLTHSSTTDVYPDTNTLSFYNATFASSYINFTSVELYSNVPSNGYYTSLQTPTLAEQSLATKYDTNQSIPFIDFGGKYVITGATYNPSLIQGKSWSQIAGSLSNASDSTAKGVDGAANTIIAAICELTNNQPANVCNQAVTSLESGL